MKSEEKKPLELYIHIPFCVKKCGYCDFLSFPAEERVQFKYMTALMKELTYYADLMQEYEVVTIFFGGGTPSILNEKWVLRLLDVIGESFSINPGAEVTMECNPGTMTKEKLLAYRENGINRLSIGLQSTDNEELARLGRIHTYEDFLEIYDLARQTGFGNINVDLMSAIPRQTMEQFARSLLRVIRLDPEHISVYSLILEEGTPFWRKYRFDLKLQEAGLPTNELPSEDEVCRMMKVTQQLLERHGYRRYEISNYSRPGFECRHNIGYWERAEYLGIGLGAASLIGSIRYRNEEDLTSYIKGTSSIGPMVFQDSGTGQRTMGLNLHGQAQTLTKEEQMEEFMYLGLRKIAGISRHDFFRAFDRPIEAIYQRSIDRLEKEGLLECRQGRIRLTERGLDLSNYALAEFLL